MLFAARGNPAGWRATDRGPTLLQMARESNLSIVCKLIAQALVDGRANADLSNMLAAYFPSASCIRCAHGLHQVLLCLIGGHQELMANNLRFVQDGRACDR